MAQESGGSNGGTASLRQSSRTKKPSRRAEEMHLTESVEVAAPTKNKRQKNQRQKKETANKNAVSKRLVDQDDGGEYDEEESEEEDEEDQEELVNKDEEAAAAEDEARDEDDMSEKSNEAFCLCRKGDDGRPMVFCAECHDWFHFKCVNLTKKVAEQLSEYICPPCQEKTGKKSKTLDDVQGGEIATSSSPGRDKSYSPPPRRSSTAAIKRKSSEEDYTRKRSRSSPHSPPKIKPPSSSSRANEPSRKSSGSYNVTAPSGSTAAMKQRSETLRKHAIDQLASTFDSIFAENPDDEEAEEDQGRKYAVSFEESLFELNSEVVAKTTIRIAGKSYRDRLRTILFNLKDKSNTSLRQKISSKELTADKLAAMGNDELANDEIRKEVEQKKKENLEQSILKKEAAPLRKLTHKGEIDIDYENANMSRMVAERENEKPVSDSRQGEAKALDDDYDLKGESRLTMSPVLSNSKASQSLPVTTTASAKAPRRTSTSIQSPTMSFDFANVWTGEQVREGDEEGNDVVSVEEEPVVDGEQTLLEGDEKVEEHADNFIDDFLGMPEEKDNNVGQEDKLADVDPYEEPLKEVEEKDFRWRGSISMPDEGICTGKVRQVAGRSLLDHEWKALFPLDYSIIEGRLPSSSAAPYLEQSQLASRTELVVMTFETSWEPESLRQLPTGTVAPSTEDENSKSFEKLLSYFQKRDRYGVLPPHPSARKSLVKDFYISPLPKNVIIPKWLDMMRTIEFQGEASRVREKDTFLLVTVLFRQNLRPTENPAYSPSHNGSASLSTHTSPSGAFSPPAPNLSSILGSAGSNTLQDLLKAVGGNKSPVTPLTAGYQSPSTHASQDQTLQQQQHPSIETLREMPRPQLEEMMYKNPSLVDQLLKTLGASKAPSPGPPIRPPGPPPPPPPGLQSIPSANPYQLPSYPQSSNYGHQQAHSPSYPPHQNDYNYRGPPQPPYPQYSSSGNQGWRPNPSYSSSYPSNHSATPPSVYGGPHHGPPVRGGYNQRGGPPLSGQRRH